jgi:hypothetical protein
MVRLGVGQLKPDLALSIAQLVYVHAARRVNKGLGHPAEIVPRHQTKLRIHGGDSGVVVLVLIIILVLYVRVTSASG